MVVGGTGAWSRRLRVIDFMMTGAEVPDPFAPRQTRPWTREERQEMEEDIENSNKFLGL